MGIKNSSKMLLLCLVMICMPVLSLADTSTPATFKEKAKLLQADQQQLADTMKLRELSCTRTATKQLLGDLGDNWSVGSHVSTQVLKYDLASKKVGSAENLGMGLAFRYYKEGVSDIKPECRAITTDAKTLDEDPKNGKIRFALFSINPTIYYSKPQNGSDANTQPAVVLSFLNDLVSFGFGFNLTGADKGHTFMLLSLGVGFNP
nr:hypothetical protein [Nitrospirota bacterium]